MTKLEACTLCFNSYQTINMLNPLLLTMSPRTLHALTEKLSEDHDEQVLRWKDRLTRRLQTNQVCTYVHTNNLSH